MALQLETPITTVEGFTVDNAYGRVQVLDKYAGESITAMVEFFTNEQAYLNGAQYLNVVGLDFGFVGPYDRNTDGVDILNLAHEYLIASLAAQGVNAIKLL